MTRCVKTTINVSGLSEFRPDGIAVKRAVLVRRCSSAVASLSFHLDWKQMLRPHNPKFVGDGPSSSTTLQISHVQLIIAAPLQFG